MNTSHKKARGEAIRAQKRIYDDARRITTQYTKTVAQSKKRVIQPTDAHRAVKLTFLGGLEEVGEKNMAIIEYQDDAIILDCGNNLGVDLPGVNYAINDMSYLETIKHKIKGYVITHGHLDHIGGLRHTVPKYPAPIYGSRYTIGVIERTFDEKSVESNFQPNLVTVHMDNHEKIALGCFMVEFIRVTHSIPDPAAVCIDTPVGKIIATGDFRLDPEPLDNLTSDTNRLKQLGEEGVLLLLSDSSYADTEGRTPTEHTLQASFLELISQARGRVVVAVFSSNINRIQMIITAAIESGRKVTLDGRSMQGYAEIAVRQGILKVPKETIIPVHKAADLTPEKLLVICTGGQGEPNASLRRMSTDNHKYLRLETGDTVIISSSPIPGNEIQYDEISNLLSTRGVSLFRHPTHELDGCGPLHVSGHARRDELREMISLVQPKFFIPIHAGSLRRRYHAQIGIGAGIPSEHVLLPQNGQQIYLTTDSITAGSQVPHGSLLIDQNGDTVSGVVLTDRLLLSEQGILTVIITIDLRTFTLLKSPDIISRGFVSMKDNEQLMRQFRAEISRFINKKSSQFTAEHFKSEIKDHITQFMYEQTGRSPIIIPVVNLVGTASVTMQHRAGSDEKRFQAMRAAVTHRSTNKIKS